jgi:hypothetical protein
VRQQPPLPATARDQIESSVFSAIALGIAANRVASSHGSTLVRAKAEMTLTRIPLGSSQAGANRKSSYLAFSVENLAR